MTPAAAWRLLGIARTEDSSAIRRAYADRLREMDLDADPDGYQRLRQARDAALAAARRLDAVSEAVQPSPLPKEALPKDLSDPPFVAPRSIAPPAVRSMSW